MVKKTHTEQAKLEEAGSSANPEMPPASVPPASMPPAEAADTAELLDPAVIKLLEYAKEKKDPLL